MNRTSFPSEQCVEGRLVRVDSDFGNPHDYELVDLGPCPDFENCNCIDGLPFCFPADVGANTCARGKAMTVKPEEGQQSAQEGQQVACLVTRYVDDICERGGRIRPKNFPEAILLQPAELKGLLTLFAADILAETRRDDRDAPATA